MHDFIIEDNLLKKYTGQKENVIIPNGITKIGKGAFSGNNVIIRVTIPEGVTTIEERAFFRCENLETIHIPSSVISVGANALHRTKWHENQPDGFIIVNNILYDFKDIDKSLVTFAEILHGITVVGKNVFKNCSNLERTTFPETLMHIDGSAFRGCANLREVKLTERLTAIGGKAFAGCLSLKSIEVPNSVTVVGEGAFRECTNLESVVFSNNIVSINKNVFAYCCSLKKIKLPNKLNSICSCAFHECVSLEEIEIPQGVTAIEYGAFWECRSLKRITVSEHLDIVKAKYPKGCKIIRMPIKNVPQEQEDRGAQVENPLNTSTNEENNTNYADVNTDDFFDRILKEAMDETQIEK